MIEQNSISPPTSDDEELFPPKILDLDTTHMIVAIKGVRNATKCIVFLVQLCTFPEHHDGSVNNVNSPPPTGK